MTHQDDPVGEGVGLLKVVRGEDDGAPALGVGVDGLPEAAAPLDVHACGRLIEDEQCRVAHECHGEAQALLLAPGALLDDARGEVGDAGAAHGLLGVDSMREETRRQLHRLTHGDVGQEAGGLHDCGDQAPVDRLARAHPEDSRSAAGRAAQPQDHVDRRRLSRTVGAQEGDDLARTNGQVDTVDGGDLTEGLVQIGQSDGVHMVRAGAFRGGGLQAGPRRCCAHGSRLAPCRLRSMAHRSLLAHDISQGSASREIPWNTGRKPVFEVEGAGTLGHDAGERIRLESVGSVPVRARGRGRAPLAAILDHSRGERHGPWAWTLHPHPP